MGLRVVIVTSVWLIVVRGRGPRVVMGTSVWLIVVRGCGPRVVLVTSVWLIGVTGRGPRVECYKRVANCEEAVWTIDEIEKNKVKLIRRRLDNICDLLL